MDQDFALLKLSLQVDLAKELLNKEGTVEQQTRYNEIVESRVMWKVTKKLYNVHVQSVVCLLLFCDPKIKPEYVSWRFIYCTYSCKKYKSDVGIILKGRSKHYQMWTIE